VRAHGGDRAVFEDDDLVRVHDRADALRDDDLRRARHFPCKRGAQTRVGREVEGRKAVVEDVDRGALRQGPGDRQTLALAPGDVGAPLGDLRLEAFAHLFHEVPGLGRLEKPPEFFVARALVSVAQVVGHGAAEQEGLLRHKADPAPQILEREPAHVDPVDEHSPSSHVVKARDETDERRLAAPGTADDGDRLARLDAEVDAGEHRLLGVRVAELDVTELDAADERHVAHGVRGVDDGRLGVQHLLDALGRGGGAGHHHEQDGRHDDREEDLDDVGEEGGQIADRHGALGDLLAAEPHDGNGREVHDDGDHREHQGEKAVHPERGLGQVSVGLAEARLFVPRTIESTDHADAAQDLARDLVHAVDLRLHRGEQRQRRPDHQGEEHEEDRDGDEHDGGERHVQAQ